MIAAGGNTTFTVRMDSSVPGERLGAVRVLSNDLDETIDDFNISGTVTGSPATGTPNVTLPEPAARYPATLQSVPISPDVLCADSDSTQYNHGSVTLEFASGGQSGDTQPRQKP